MTEEQRDILKMLHERTLTPEDAERLLDALEEGVQKKRRMQENPGTAASRNNSDGIQNILNTIKDGVENLGEIISESVSSLGTGIGTVIGDMFAAIPGGKDFSFDEYGLEDFASVPLSEEGFSVDGIDALILTQKGGGAASAPGNLELSSQTKRAGWVGIDGRENVSVFRKDSLCVVVWRNRNLAIRIPSGLKSLSVQSLHGEIRTEGTDCPVRLLTMQGNIEAKQVRQSFRIDTFHGNIALDLASDWTDERPIKELSRAQAMQGNVELRYEAGFRARIVATAFRGEIDAPDARVEQEILFPLKRRILGVGSEAGTGPGPGGAAPDTKKSNDQTEPGRVLLQSANGNIAVHGL